MMNPFSIAVIVRETCQISKAVLKKHGYYITYSNFRKVFSVFFATVNKHEKKLS